MSLGGQEQGVREWVPEALVHLRKLARGQAYSVGWVFGSTIGYGLLINTDSLLEGRPLAPSSLTEKQLPLPHPIHIISPSPNFLLCLGSLQLLPLYSSNVGLQSIPSISHPGLKRPLHHPLDGLVHHQVRAPPLTSFWDFLLWLLKVNLGQKASGKAYSNYVLQIRIT